MGTEVLGVIRTTGLEPMLMIRPNLKHRHGKCFKRTRSGGRLPSRDPGEVNLEALAS